MLVAAGKSTFYEYLDVPANERLGCGVADIVQQRQAEFIHQPGSRIWGAGLARPLWPAPALPLGARIAAKTFTTPIRPQW